MVVSKKTMKQTLSLALLATLPAFAGGKYVAPVEAEVKPIPMVQFANPLYLGVGVVSTFIQRDPCPCYPTDPDIKDDQEGVVLRIGADYNQYIGLEGRYFKTLGEDVFSEVEHYGLYLKPQYPLSEKMNMYGLIGYGKTTVDYTNGNISSHNVENSVGYGIGFEYDFTSETTTELFDRPFDGYANQERGWGVWVDVQHLLKDASSMHTDLNIVTVGVTYDF